MISFRHFLAVGLAAGTFESLQAPISPGLHQAGIKNQVSLGNLNTWMKDSGFPEERISLLLNNKLFIDIMSKMVDSHSEPTLEQLKDAIEITESLLPHFPRSEEQNAAFLGVLYDKIAIFAQAGNDYNLNVGMADPKMSTPRDLLSQAEEKRYRLGTVPKILEIGTANGVPEVDSLQYAQRFVSEQLHNYGDLLSLHEGGNKEGVRLLLLSKDGAK